jgi:hypothetical protein
LARRRVPPSPFYSAIYKRFEKLWFAT